MQDGFHLGYCVMARRPADAEASWHWAVASYSCLTDSVDDGQRGADSLQSRWGACELTADGRQTTRRH